MKTQKILVTWLWKIGAVATVVLSVGCSKQGNDADNANNAAEHHRKAAAHASALVGFMLDEKPAGAISVIQARKVAQPGEPIVVTGQIGAAADPFNSSFASLIIGDEALQYCNEIPDDHCPEPWDACCEDPEKVKASRASVQILSDSGPVQDTLKGVGGLKELDKIIVVGTVNPASTPDNLIIDATGIFRDEQD